MAASSDTGSNDRVTITDDVAIYKQALPQFSLDIVQTGPGSGPSKIRLAEETDVTIGSLSIEFPILGHFEIPPNEAAVIAITSAPESARWAGVDLEAGMVLLYGPGMHHTGVSPPGLEITYATYHVRSTDERVRRDLKDPAKETAAVFRPGAIGKGLGPELEGIAQGSVGMRNGMLDDVETLVDALVRKGPVMTSRRLATSRLIVAECIKIVDARGATTTMPELLHSADASPRRLRQAFDDAYRVAPMRFLQLRVLNSARQQLSSPCHVTTVTQVASDLGVTHMGRFAARYRDVFGEQPSATVNKARSREIRVVA